MMKALNLSSRSLFIVNKDRKVRQIDGLNCERGLIKPCNVTWMYRQTNTALITVTQMEIKLKFQANMLINKCSQVKIETGLTKLKRTKINE